MAIFYTDTASFNSLTVTGSTVMSASINNFALNLIGSGSTIFSVSGSSGSIFTVTDAAASDATLFSVATGSTNIFSVDQSKNINLSGSVTITGSLSLNADSIVTSNQTGSFVTSAQTGSFATTGSNNFTNNQTITGSLIVTGSTLITGSAGTLFQVGSNILFVSSSGNVGIGTTTPPASVALDVAGAIRSSTQLSSATARINYIAGNTQNLQFSSGSAATQTTTVAATMFTGSGNWVYQAAQNATDLGYKIAINSSGVSGSLYVSGSTVMTGSLRVTGSLSISDVLVLPFQSPLPSGKPTGSVALSGSGGTFVGMFVYNGTAWTNVKA
jgi:hypothetical protein